MGSRATPLQLRTVRRRLPALHRFRIRAARAERAYRAPAAHRRPRTHPWTGSPDGNRRVAPEGRRPRSSAVTASAAVERALAAIDAREADVHAWAHVDADAARRTAAAIDASPDGRPLRGYTVGVKDVFDTADMPTEYGSPIYAGHRPTTDAIAASLLRDAGAVCLGKTVTAEFAMFHP